MALFLTRRLTIEGKQIDQVKRYVNAGKPLVALRTASHGFQNWLEVDGLVLGGNYRGHYPGNPEQGAIDGKGNRFPEGQPEGPTLEVKTNTDAKNHPIMNGVGDSRSKYSLYKTSPVAPDVNVLPGVQVSPQESRPSSTRIYKGGRVCYIALGGLQDFENPAFTRLLTNAIFWAAERHPEGKSK